LFRYASAFFMTMASGGGRRRRAGLCGNKGESSYLVCLTNI
jgi:hypothetical protein